MGLEGQVLVQAWCSEFHPSHPIETLASVVHVCDPSREGRDRRIPRGLLAGQPNLINESGVPGDSLSQNQTNIQSKESQPNYLLRKGTRYWPLPSTTTGIHTHIHMHKYSHLHTERYTHTCPSTHTHTQRDTQRTDSSCKGWGYQCIQLWRATLSYIWVGNI